MTGIQQTITKQQWDDDQGQVMSSLGDTIDSLLELSKGEPLLAVIDIKPRKRTDAQNRFMWPLIRAIGNAAGEPDEERTKRHLLTEWAGERFIEVMGRKQQAYPRTSQFKPKQMANFIEWLQAYAVNEYGIRPPMPADYETYAREARS